MDQGKPESRGLLYILLSGFAFFSGWSLSKRFTSNKQSVDVTPTQDTTDKERERGRYVPPSPTRVAIESFPSPKAPAEERKREKQKKKRFRWLGLGVNVLTLGAVIWYACVATQQRNEMIKQNALMQQSLWNQHEPSIGIVGIRPLDNFPVEQRVEWTIKNYGDSPARRVVVGAFTIDEKLVLRWKVTGQAKGQGPCHHSGIESANDPTYPGRTIPPQGTLVGQEIVSDFLNQRVTSGIRYVIVCVAYQDTNFAFWDQPPEETLYNIYNTKALYTGKAKGNTDVAVSSAVDHFELRDEDTYAPRRPNPQ
jgi:hypothetical protein